MRLKISIALTTLVSLMAYSQTKVELTVGDNTMTAILADNEATRELTKLLEKGDIKLRMSDYGGFEKVGTLPHSLPTSSTAITTESGDIMLYQGNSMVIFYGSNSWSYTPLGKIDGATPSKLKQFLGNGDITLTLTLAATSGIEACSTHGNIDPMIYDLGGNRISRKPLPAGIYIIDGKKYIIKQ